MEHTTLLFPSMAELWQFIKLAQLKNYHFDTAACSLRADVGEDELWIAKTKCKAKVVEREKTA
jgi:hypothetical protein